MNSYSCMDIIIACFFTVFTLKDYMVHNVP